MGITNFPGGVEIAGSAITGNQDSFFDKSQTNINWFVDDRNGSDSNSGTSTNDPLLTIAAAITKANNAITWTNSPWGPRHTIKIAPGLYPENLTELPYGCNLIGMGDAWDINGERGVTIKPASGSPVDCTSIINSRIENICFEAPDTSVIFQADNLNRNVIINCVFQGLPGASPTTTRGIEVVLDMTGTIITGCHFRQIRNAIYLVADNANQKQITGNLIQYCDITGGDQTGIYFDINCVPSNTIIKNCNIGGGGATLALGLDDNTGIVHVYNTNFQCTACDPASADPDSKYNNCYLNGALMT